MLQVRKNVFETNSSSTHSLVISKKDREYDYCLPVEDDGTLVVTFGEFGWGPEVLAQPIEKLTYLVTDRCNLYDLSEEDPHEGEELQEFIKSDENIQEIIEVVKSCCPDVQDIRFELCDSWDPFGYVDHQSQGTSYESGLSIEEIIFSNKVIILIDNDNSCNFEEYYTDWQGNPPTRDIENLFRV